MTLGENIYYYRTQKNWSQGDLADALDVSRQSISKWENNLASPDLDKLLKLRSVFDVTLDELVLGTAADESAQTIGESAPDATAESTEAVAPVATAETTSHPPFYTQQIPVNSVSGILSMRHVFGFAMLLFGLIFFLLSIFWGDSLYFSEAVGELTSILIVLVSLFILAPYNCTVISVCGIVYVVYCVICYSVLNIQSISNDIFLLATSFVLVSWFIVCGLHQNKLAKSTPSDANIEQNGDVK